MNGFAMTFLTFCDYLKMYTTFCNNYANSIATLKAITSMYMSATERSVPVRARTQARAPFICLNAFWYGASVSAQ